jgi:hypothetical protein
LSTARLRNPRADFDDGPAVPSPNLVASGEDFGARLSQPQRIRKDKNDSSCISACVGHRRNCGWDSRAPVWLRLGRALSAGNPVRTDIPEKSVHLARNC